LKHAVEFLLSGDGARVKSGRFGNKGLRLEGAGASSDQQNSCGHGVEGGGCLTGVSEALSIDIYTYIQARLKINKTDDLRAKEREKLMKK
jgi:hypothetical protein